MSALPPEERARRNETRKRHKLEREARAIVAWAEHQAQLSALRAVRDDPAALPADKLRAVELITQLEENEPPSAWRARKTMENDDRG